MAKITTKFVIDTGTAGAQLTITPDGGWVRFEYGWETDVKEPVSFLVGRGDLDAIEEVFKKIRAIPI